MSYTAHLTERLKLHSLVMTSACDVTGSKQTATIDMSLYRRLLVIGLVQNSKETNTVPHATIKILDSTVTGTTATTSITSGTTMSQTAGVMRNRVLEIRDENVGKKTTRSGTGRYVRVRGVYGTRGAQVALIVIAGDPRFGAQSNTVTVA